MLRVQTFLAHVTNPKDYVGALEDLDLALQIEPENPFPQCCRAEADSCSWFCLQKTSRKRWVEDYRDH